GCPTDLAPRFREGEPRGAGGAGGYEPKGPPFRSGRPRRSGRDRPRREPMKKLLALAGVLVAALVLVTVAGSWMEPRPVVSRTLRFAASPERVWTALLSIRQLPFDRSDLKEMERALDKDRFPASIEVLGSRVRIEAPI